MTVITWFVLADLGYAEMVNQNPNRTDPILETLENYEENFDPIAENATEKEKVAYIPLLNGYSSKMLQCLKNSSFSGEDLWIEFSSTFRDHLITYMIATGVVNWIDSLRSRGVHI